MDAWIVNHVLPLVQQGNAAYVILLAATFLESFVLTGLFVPGTVLLLVLGGVASYGHLDMPVLVVMALVGALAGNMVSFELGKWQRSAPPIKPKPTLWDRSNALLHRYKGPGIILCRFIGPIRPIVPFLAGRMNMSRSSFHLYSTSGGIAWICAYLACGYAFGTAWKAAAAWSSFAVALGVSLLTIFWLGIVLLRRRVSA